MARQWTALLVDCRMFSKSGEGSQSWVGSCGDGHVLVGCVALPLSWHEMEAAKNSLEMVDWHPGLLISLEPPAESQ